MAPTSSRNPSLGPEVPKKLGKYHVRDVLGRGSMGVVYAGYDPYADRDVAIKVCDVRSATNTASPDVTRKLFFNEAHAAGILDHQNIIRLHDAGEHEGLLYIVSELIEGGETLKSYCQPERLLALRSVAEIAHTCARALDYAHRRGVVHRDIKPSNIIVGQDGRLRICDFGIAQRSFDDATHVNALMGSPAYMSPEQIEERMLGGQTDIYSLGVVVFELLCARRPYPQNSIASLIEAILHTDAPDVREHRPDIPEAMARIVARAMHKDLSQRYGSGAALARELSGLFHDLEDPEDGVSEDEKFKVLRGLRFFSEFSDIELWEILRLASWCEYGVGDSIVVEGSSDLAFFVLLEGQTAVCLGHAQVTHLGPGDCFGEVGYLRREPRTATIVASIPTRALKVHPALVDRASMPVQVRFHRAFALALTDRLARAERRRPTEPRDPRGLKVG